MKNYKSLHGVIVPLVTPFNEQNQIDFEGLRNVVDFVVEKGVHAVMIGGTTGEGMLLNLDERKKLLEVIIDQVNGKIPVIAHTGCIDTGSSVELTKHASLHGADFISAITPYFFTLTDDQIYDHFMSVSEAAHSIPMLLYTFPGNAKNDISPSLLKRLLKTGSNIIGIKSSNADLIRFQDYVNVGGKGFSSCFGVDELMLGGLVFGSNAQISGNANSFPEPFIKLYEAFSAGNLLLAQELQQTVNAIVDLHKAGRTPAYFKATLKLRGIPAGYVRAPMCELSSKEVDEVKKKVKLLDLI